VEKNMICQVCDENQVETEDDVCSECIAVILDGFRDLEDPDEILTSGEDNE